MPSPLHRQTPMPQAMPNQQMPVGHDSPMQRMIFNMLYQRNPKFREVADSLRGQDPVQACQNLGYDYNQLQNIDITQVKRMFGF